MNRQHARRSLGLLTTLVLAALVARFISLRRDVRGSGNPDEQLVAFSLAEAERQIGTGRSDIANLGSMTRLMGLVYDRPHRDLILVGRVEPRRRSLDLASLAVATRAVVVHHQWPLVSIDPTPESPITHKQTVRLEGAIADSQFGQDFLLADVRLKRLGLGLETADLETWSYFRLRAEAARHDVGGGGRSRFWFYALEPGLEQRDDVFLIRQLKLGVRAQTLVADGAPGVARQDAAAETFAATFTRSFSDLCRKFPDLDRLQGLYEMVAAARGMQMIPDSVPDFLLKGYEIPTIPTPREFELVGRQERIETAGGPQYLEVSGGIQFKALTVRLLDGDVTALKEAVLLSRPNKSAVSWWVPIGKDSASTLPKRRGTIVEPTISDAGSQLTWELESAKRAAQQKAILDQGVAEIDRYLKKNAAPAFLQPIEQKTETDGTYHTSDHGLTNYLKDSPLEAAAQSTGPYHSSDAGKTNYLNGSTLEKAANSRGMYHYDATDNTFKLNESPQIENAGSGTGGGSLCIGPACIGPRQATTDGMKADPYYRANLDPYSLNRFVDAGYTVSQDGKTIGSGYQDVKLLGNGRYAAKEGQESGYRIHDASGKSISGAFDTVQPIGETGFFAVPNEGGLGMTTVYDSQMRTVHTVPSYDLNRYLQGVGFQNELQKGVEATAADPIKTTADPINQKVGGIKADIRISDKDVQDRRRGSK